MDYAAWADQYRRDSAKAYRQGRKALSDVERWNQAAINCDKHAAWWEGRVGLPDDPEDEMTPAEHAALARRNAECFRRLAVEDAERAPQCRDRARDYTRLARKYQVMADEQSARIAEWVTSAERAEWLARPENASLRDPA